MKLCSFVFAVGALGLIIATANEAFGLGLFENDYPLVAGSENGSGPPTGSYGEYLLQTGLITLGAGFLGSILYYYVGDREELADVEYDLVDLAYLWREPGEYVFTCPDCGRKFRTAEAAAQHYEDTHL